MQNKSEGVNIHFPTPECDKLSKVSKDSQKIGAFLDWLQNEQSIVLAEWGKRKNENPDRLYPIYKSIEEWLAKYFEIDLDKVENERQALLNGIRASHGAA